MNFLDLSHQEIQKKSATIILLSAHNKTDLDNLTELLVSKIHLSKDTQIMIALIAALKIIIKKKQCQLKEDSVRILLDILSHANNIEIEYDILDVFSTIEDISKLSIETKQLMALRKQEQYFMTETNIDRCAVILPILAKNYRRLANSTIIHLEKILEKSDEKSLVTLEIFSKSETETFDSHAALEKISQLFTKPLTTDAAYRFFLTIISFKRPLPANVIKSLFNLMLYEEKFKLRKLSFEILKSTTSYQKIGKDQEKIISLEQDGYSARASISKITKGMIENLLFKIRKEKILSITNCNVLILLLNYRNHILHQPILNVFYELKAKIPRLMYEELLETLLRYLSNPIQDPIIASSLSKYLLEQIYLIPESIKFLLIHLQKSIQFSNNKIVIFQLLKLLIEKAPDYHNSDFIESIINHLLTTKDLEKQTILSDLLFTLLKRTQKYSPSIVQYLFNLLNLIVNDSLILSNLDKNSRTVTWKKSLVYCKTHLSKLWGKCRKRKQDQHFSLETKVNLIKIIGYAYRKDVISFKSKSLSLLKLLRKFVCKRVKLDEEFLIKLKNLKSRQRINILFTLSLVEYYDPKILDKYAEIPDIYARELLNTDLIMRCLKQENAQEDLLGKEVFYRHLTELEDVRKYQTYSESRDNLLMLLISYQKKYNLNLQSINRLLVFLKVCDLDPETILSENEDDFKYNWLMHFLPKFFKNTVKEDLFKDILQRLKSLNWDTEIIYLFLSKIKNCQDSLQLKDFLIFLVEFNIDQTMMEDILNENALLKDTTSLAQLYLEAQKKIIINLLDATINTAHRNNLLKKDSTLVSSFKVSFLDKIVQLLKLNWSFKKLYDLLVTAHHTIRENRFCHLDDLYKSLDIAYCYQLSEKVFFEHNLLVDPNSAMQNLHTIGIKNHLTMTSQEKDLITLLNELTETNTHSPTIKKLLKEDSAEKIFSQIAEQSHDTRLLSGYCCRSPVIKWKKAQIKKWSIHIKEHANQQRILPEILAVMKRACYLSFGYEPRFVQLLSIWIFTHCHDKGRLAEIVVGEGKSLTIAMLAVLSSLKGETVDIVTSSSELAKRDAEEHKSFYELFNLNIADNRDQGYTRGLKPCYGSNIHIVYGSINDFQFDVLRDEYSHLGTRGSRGFDRVIVDEVDNLLIDEGAKIAMLANVMAGMDHLKPVLILIWLELTRISKGLMKDGPIYYYQEQGLSVEESPMLEITQPFEFIENKISLYLQSVLKEHTHLIPKHLEDFFKIQSPKWIKNAILAQYQYIEGRDYTIKRSREGTLAVVPVDFANTGMIQSGTTWGDGLHQFLQLKHGVEMTSESLVVNFISNIAYIKRYKNKIYGLTGTLGSPEAQKLLTEIYPIDCVYIPCYKTKQFYEIPGVVASSTEDWLHEVTSSAIREAKHGRVSLILCETMNHVKHLAERLRKEKAIHLKLYTGDEQGSGHFLTGAIEGHTIIIATNIASRGTDIKLAPKVIERGGLHVCYTFLPLNLRVEKQGFGRTSRAGTPGTAQLILNQEELIKKLPVIQQHYLDKRIQLTIHEIRKLRDEQEKLHLDHCRATELPRTQAKDKLYDRFRILLKTLHERGQSNITAYQLKGVEERFGIWLKKVEGIASEKEAEELFQVFQKEIIEDSMQNRLIKNPYYYINEANELLVYCNGAKGKLKSFFSHDLYRQALKAFDKAIDLDPNAYMAHYKKIYILIKLRSRNYKKTAKLHILEASRIIRDYALPHILTLNQLLNNNQHKKKKAMYNALSFQLNAKVQSLQLLLESLQEMMSAIETSQKLIDISFNTAAEKIYFNKLTTEQAKKAITFRFKPVTICFNHLSTHSDITTQSEPKKMIELINDSAEISIIFDIKKDKNKLISLLPINRHRKEIDYGSKETKENSKKESDRNISFRDKLHTISKSASEVAAAISNKIGEKIDPVKEKYRNFQDKRHGYDAAERLPVNLKIESLPFLETLKIIRILEPEKTITLILKEPNASVAKKILNSSYKDKLFMELYSEQTCDRLDLPYICQRKTSGEVEKGCSIIFENLLTSYAVEFLEILQKDLEEITDALSHKPNITLVITHLTQKQAESIIKQSDGSIILSFTALNKENASKIIALTEKNSRETVFKIHNLSTEEAKHLIESVKREEQDLTVNLKPIEEVIPRLKKAKAELYEYHLSGFIFLSTVQENIPLAWRSILLVTSLGILQIGAGLALTATTLGFGTSFGLGLIAEGIADLLRAATTLYSREFSWSSYVLGKSASLALSLVTAGWATAQLSKVKAVSSELLDDIAVQSMTIAKSTFKSGMQTATKQLLTQSVEKTVISATNHMLDIAADHGLEQLESSITTSIYEEMQIRIQNGIWSEHLNKIFLIDSFLNNQIFFQKILQEAELIIKEMHIVTMGARIISSEVFAEFSEKFSKSLHQMKDTVPTFQRLFLKRYWPSFTKEKTKEICNLLQSHSILTVEGHFNLRVYSEFVEVKKINELCIEAHQDCEAEITEACHDLVMLASEDFYSQKKMLAEKLTTLFATQYLRACRLYVGILKSGTSFLASFGIQSAVRKIIPQGLPKGLKRSQRERKVVKKAITARKNLQSTGKAVTSVRNINGQEVSRQIRLESRTSLLEVRRIQTGEVVELTGKSAPIAAAAPDALKTGQSKMLSELSLIKSKGVHNIKMTGVDIEKIKITRGIDGPTITKQIKFLDTRKPFAGGNRFSQVTGRGKGVGRPTIDIEKIDKLAIDRKKLMRQTILADKRKSFKLTNRFAQYESESPLLSASRKRGIATLPRELQKFDPSIGRKSVLEKAKLLGKDTPNIDTRTHLPTAASTTSQTETVAVPSSTPPVISMPNSNMNMLNKSTKAFFTMAHTALVGSHEANLLVFYAQKERILKKMHGDISDENMELQYQLVEEEKKIIRTLIGLIVIEKQLSYDMSRMKKINVDLKTYQENIFKRAEFFMNKCMNRSMKDITNGYLIIVNELNKSFNIDASNIHMLFSKLNRSFISMNKLIHRESTMASSIGEICTTLTSTNRLDLNAVVGNLFEQIDKKNYSEYALLLKDGKLGETGFIAGNLIDGMIKCRMQSIAAHARMQKMLINITQVVVEKQIGLAREVIAIEARRAEIVKVGLANMNKQLEKALNNVDRAADLSEKALEKGEEAIKLAHSFLELAKTACHMVEGGLKSAAEVCRSNGIDPEIVTKCVTASLGTINMSLNTLQVLGKEDASAAAEMAASGKEAIMKLVENWRFGANKISPAGPTGTPSAALTFSPTAERVVVPPSAAPVVGAAAGGSAVEPTESKRGPAHP